MALDKWTEIDRYLERALLPPDPALEEALEASSAAGIPGIQVSPLQGKLLMMLAEMLKASNILEIGTLAGYSTIWLARGLAKNGRIVTLEADPHHAQLARTNFVRAGLSDTIELRVGRALDTLPQLAAEGAGPFDLCFIDADKKRIPEYFTWALKLSRPGGLIVVDNVVREGEVVDDESSEPSIEGIRRFLAMLREEGRVSGTALQTVGIKGHDGFALLRIRA